MLQSPVCVRHQTMVLKNKGALTNVSLLVFLINIKYHFVMSFGGLPTRRLVKEGVLGLASPTFHNTQSKRWLHVRSSSLSLTVQTKQFPSSLQSKFVLYSTSVTGSASTTFQPPEPPGTKGTPIFPDITILKSEESNHHENAARRNTDSNAVMVVTGSNRGIGLQFVKSLIHRTKVRTHNFQ